jgi:hypothetical protein
MNCGNSAARMTFAVLTVALGFLMLRDSPNGTCAGPFCAHAQNLGERVVLGAVVDANSAPVAGATVFLKDLKSKNIRSYTSDEKGHFRFAQVNMAQEHELWAEKDGKKTAVKTVSSWDTRKQFEVELKLK